jgi:hypothetical protein
LELEKFAINSVVSATHTSQMDNEDKNDIIKKVETAGSNDGSDDNNAELNADNNQEQPIDNQQDNNEQPDLNEESNFILQNPKKSSIFAPKGSKEHMEINDLKETIKNKLNETFLTKDRLDELYNEIIEKENNIQQPEVKPTETKPSVAPTKEPLRKNKPFLPPTPKTQPDPKANGNKDTLIDEATTKNFEVYHNTFSSAVQTAQQYAESKGYTIDENEWFNQIATGPKKPEAGKTNRYSVSLIANGKPSNKTLNIQVYNMGNRYELNCYIA